MKNNFLVLLRGNNCCTISDISAQYKRVQDYDNSQETHWMRLRQQDPATSLWSMCQITTFASAAGARVSIIVDWYYTGATFTVPTV